MHSYLQNAGVPNVPSVPLHSDTLILDEIIKLSKKGRGRGGVAKGGTRGRGVGRGRGGGSNRQQPNVGGANVSLFIV